MAQAMITAYVREQMKCPLLSFPNINVRHIATQTGSDDEFFFHLNRKKTARVYYSTVYKYIVLSLNLGSSKSFIIDKSSWIAIKNNIEEINKRFNL